MLPAGGPVPISLIRCRKSRCRRYSCRTWCIRQGRSGARCRWGRYSNTVATRSTSVGTPYAPSRYCRRHLNSRLALTSLRRAISATDAPGSKVYSTSRRLNSVGKFGRLCARPSARPFDVLSTWVSTIIWWAPNYQPTQSASRTALPRRLPISIKRSIARQG